MFLPLPCLTFEVSHKSVSDISLEWLNTFYLTNHHRLVSLHRQLLLVLAKQFLITRILKTTDLKIFPCLSCEWFHTILDRWVVWRRYFHHAICWDESSGLFVCKNLDNPIQIIIPFLLLYFVYRGEVSLGPLGQHSVVFGMGRSFRERVDDWYWVN